MAAPVVLQPLTEWKIGFNGVRLNFATLSKHLITLASLSRVIEIWIPEVSSSGNILSFWKMPVCKGRHTLHFTKESSSKVVTSGLVILGL